MSDRLSSGQAPPPAPPSRFPGGDEPSRPLPSALRPPTAPGFAGGAGPAFASRRPCSAMATPCPMGPRPTMPTVCPDSSCCTSDCHAWARWWAISSGRRRATSSIQASTNSEMAISNAGPESVRVKPRSRGLLPDGRRQDVVHPGAGRVQPADVRPLGHQFREAFPGHPAQHPLGLVQPGHRRLVLGVGPQGHAGRGLKGRAGQFVADCRGHQNDHAGIIPGISAPCLLTSRPAWAIIQTQWPL